MRTKENRHSAALLAAQMSNEEIAVSLVELYTRLTFDAIDEREFATALVNAVESIRDGVAITLLKERAEVIQDEVLDMQNQLTEAFGFDVFEGVR